ncbi:hypothetical protein [Chelativorans sp. Marseille-P2723]|uniref:hypothetical protein n=1 Tax=Chelativorans sp. Marseille-P2723 TaxID=2709133 RepID=UPI001570CDD2|nr:hypothetical protein [Chelativorans sp. Marseille-P2723]
MISTVLAGGMGCILSHGALAQVIDANGITINLPVAGSYPNFSGLLARNGGTIVDDGDISTIVDLSMQQRYAARAQANSHIALDGVQISNPGFLGPGPRGLAAEGTGSTLTATNIDISLQGITSTRGDNGTGLRAVNDGEVTVTNGSVVMTGGWNHGIVASYGTVNVENVDITVNGQADDPSRQAYGAFAISESASAFGPSTIDLDADSTVTMHSPVSGIGLYALGSVSGTLHNARIVSSATVVTDGASRGIGAYAAFGGEIILQGGTVTTAGDDSYGLYSSRGGSRVVAEAGFGGVTTTGPNSPGVLAERLNAGFAGLPAVVELNGTRIVTTGFGSSGIQVRSGGRVYDTGHTVPPGTVLNDLVALYDGELSASRSSANGIYLDSLAQDGGGNSYVQTSGSVMGGYGAATASGIRLTSDLPTLQSVLVDSGSTVGALSDVAIYARNGQNPGGSIIVGNGGTLTGYVMFLNAPPQFTNEAGGVFDVRNFADTDGDGLRDTKAVSMSDFGGLPGASFDNLAGATVRFDPVAGAGTIDVARIYTPATGIDSRPLEAGFYNLDDGRSQGHFVNLKTFSNAGTIDLRGPSVGNLLLITGGGGVDNQGGIVAGNGVFISNGGELLVNAVLNDGIAPGGQTNSYADVLVVDSTELGDGGPTLVTVTNVGGAGAPTTGNGIEIVEVLDKSDGASAANAFILNGDFMTSGGDQAILAGAYAYTLQHNGLGGDSADGNWYLRSIFQPATTIYEAYPQVLLDLGRLPTMQQRVGNRYWKDLPKISKTMLCKNPAVDLECPVTDVSAAYQVDGDRAIVFDERGIWARIEGIQTHVEPELSTTSTNYDSTMWKLQTGLDLLLYEASGGGTLIGAITAHYGHADVDVAALCR